MHYQPQFFPTNADEVLKPTIICFRNFKIDGVNATCAIRELKQINGLPIKTIEKRLRKISTGSNIRYGRGVPIVESHGSLLGDNDKLIDTLVADNDVVLKAGLTHRVIADLLWKIIEGNTIEYNGKKFHITCVSWRSDTAWPFANSSENTLDTHQSEQSRLYYIADSKYLGTALTGLEIPGILISAISMYGFYGGKGSDCRLDPGQVIKFLGISPKFNFVKKCDVQLDDNQIQENNNIAQQVDHGIKYLEGEWHNSYCSLL